MAGAESGGHHHRTSLKSKKPFKSRHSSKSSVKDKLKGKVERPTDGAKPKKHTSTKADRRNAAKQVQAKKREETIRNNRIFDGRRGAPRIVAIVPLCADVDGVTVVKNLNASIEQDVEVKEGLVNVQAERFKQKLQYIVVDRDYVSIVDACKAADFTVFILSANQEVDEFGELCLRSIQSQGISNVVTVVQHLDTVDGIKTKADVKKSLLSFISYFFPTEEKVHAIDSAAEALNVVRALCTQHPSGINWRENRSYVLAESVTYEEEGNNVVVEGIVRGKGLNVDRLVHIQGWGDYQIEKICSVPEENKKGRGMDVDMEEANNVLAVPTEEQDSTEALAPEEEDDEEMEMDSGVEGAAQPKGVRLDDHYYFDKEEEPVKNIKLPKGTSKYQAEWITEEGSDAESSDEEDEDDEEMDNGEEEDEGFDEPRRGISFATQSEYAPTEFGDDEMHVDLDPEEEMAQLEAYRQAQRERSDDLEFPDEVEAPPDMPASERFKKYRGMKSFRTSPWDADESDPNAPAEWKRLARFENYKATKNRVIKQGQFGGVAAGTRVQIYLRDCPREIAEKYDGSKPFLLTSLLQYEHKTTVLNFQVTPNTEYNEPIKAKDPLILQCGARRYVVKPLYSQFGNSSNNVAKFERYLHPGRTSVATVIGPAVFGNVPVLLLRETPNGLKLVASGSFLDTDHRRVIAKRIVLTGIPYKIHKRVVTIRYMFFSDHDVNWFKAIQLFTKYGKTGYIKESLGTHGYFKATFDAKINQQDTIGMSLYKRVFPRMVENWRAEA
ncbi:DUF663-domain-containing protein [Saitoella complicata NRRL Y-17804]|uniref:Bms1-type G domain-containing protein n=1 Tax=Saitoella complicata (strain BCRC 22490 / CBS 7301 / JCM 7358 / NBRC 10748 / NRRL Y-17804) TaxID=698492 RepID=A0A0E9N9B1_SAICN|nr:DUF663-domain-containing protein [Saitoella complicata NRRL Y-17804]ODQ56554.1 DUF663-domain-containing protein [Saitoella complicata NRRL Y-17804]GAO46472.1 hypothetical protein G7K_0703-t1 [Saitoella complicata NRRL Y-17804]